MWPIYNGIKEALYKQIESFVYTYFYSTMLIDKRKWNIDISTDALKLFFNSNQLH